MVTPSLSVIVRFHNRDRLFELRRCLFSLVCQSYAPLEICLVTQRFSDAESADLQESLASLLSLNDSVQFASYNYAPPEPKDARSALINLGIEAARGRYLAFLDHDDTILPFGYQQLIQELERSAAAVAFASVAYKDIDVFEDALLVDRRLEAFAGKNLLDLFDHNFCPIHSFVIDRSRVDRAHLWFDTALTRHEDYEFLLRLCARYKSSFELIGTFAGDYYLKNDGSNTNTWLSGEEGGWGESTAFLEKRKSEIVISAAVQTELGLAPTGWPMHISQLLKACHDGLNDHS
jgi:glycosyltransferase involved in cell wall biosynthesis